jgi:NhaC family Na+:H+ antiporter
MNVLASDQYLSIVVPGRMFRKAYEDRGLAAKNLSRVLEDAGTITSPLIGWNTCGATMAVALGVGAGQYWMFCFFNLINPLVSIVLGFTGWTIVKTVSSKPRV